MAIGHSIFRASCSGSLMAVLVLGTAAMGQQNATPPSPAIRLTLQDALERARHNSVTYQSVMTSAGVAREDQRQALGALLPRVNYNNAAIYSEGPGSGGSPVKFIANNAVHEYLSQGNVHESLDAVAFADLWRTRAVAAAARARAEIAARGLVVTVVLTYYSASAAQEKVESSERAAEEGERFFKITQDLESGGEVAHSDVLKAELQLNDRHRQLREAKLTLLNTRLDLAVLIFPTLNDTFELAEDLHATVPLPSLSEVQRRAAEGNPEIRVALEAVKAAGYEVSAARLGYLPSLSFDYFYGIDSAHFATKTDGVSNIGSSAVATLNIPIWNWGATQSKVKQSELRRDQAKRELSLAQRKLLAELQSLYAESDAASSELASLRRSAELSREYLRLTTLRYKDGEATVLEVVDAQATAAVADTAYQDGAVRYRVALANLETLTGALTAP